jgi:hypothetical protein
MKQLSINKPLADYAPKKDSTIQRITKEAQANIMGVIEKIEKQKQTPKKQEPEKSEQVSKRDLDR